MKSSFIETKKFYHKATQEAYPIEQPIQHTHLVQFASRCCCLSIKRVRQQRMSNIHNYMVNDSISKWLDTELVNYSLPYFISTCTGGTS